MKSFIVLLAVCLFALAGAEEESNKETGPKHSKLVLCRLSLADYNSQNPNFDSTDADYSLCTDLIVTKTRTDDEEQLKREEKNTENLRKEYPDLKIHAELPFGELVRDYFKQEKDEAKKKFIEGVVKIVTDSKFDGLNLNGGDLEYLKKEFGYKSEQLEAFVKGLKSSLVEKKLKLVISISATEKVLTSGISLAHYAEPFDLIVLSPEYVVNELPTKDATIDNLKEAMNIVKEEKKVDLWLKELEIPKEKLIMGLYFGGASIENKAASRIGYNQICKLQENKNKYTGSYDGKASVAVLESKEGVKKVKQVVFMSSRSIANRVRYATKQGLAGILADTIAADDNIGKCDLESDTFVDFKPSKEGINIKIPKREKSDNEHPLLRTVNEAIVVALDELVQEKPDDGDKGDGDKGDGDKDNGANAISMNISFAVAIAVVAFLLH